MNSLTRFFGILIPTICTSYFQGQNNVCIQQAVYVNGSEVTKTSSSRHYQQAGDDGSVSYVGFNQTSGQVKEKSGTVTYNASSGSGIAFGFSAYLTTTGTYSVPGDFAFSYDFSAAYTPVYRLGSTEPLAVKLMGGAETMSVTRTGIHDPSFSGVKASDVLFDMNGSTGIQIFGLKFLCDNDTSESLNINISGAVVNTTSVSYGVGQIALTETTFNKYF